MRVIGQVAPPGVQNPHQADLTANETQVFCQALRGRRGNPKEQIVEQALVAAHDSVQRRRQGEGQHEIGHRQEQILLCFPPFLGLVILAFRAVTIATGMVTVLHLAAFRAGIDLPAQGFGTALFDSAHRLPVARQDLIGELPAIGRTVLAKDIRQF